MLPLLERPQDSLFWTAPPEGATEFTPEDPLALDYLSQQVGLFLLPTLTTRTSRAQSYAVVSYGLHLAEIALKANGLPDTDEQRETLFRRWERFWALATLEFHGGRLRRGDRDAMRGIRGATRAWEPGDRSLPLDYRLIDRQSELGSLGAYLASLRLSHLVFPGTLRTTHVAGEIAESFWSDDSPRREYEAYALEALDLARQRIERKHRRLTLAKIGEESRLSVLRERGRRPQQDRLWKALFEDARDRITLPLALLVRRAARRRQIEPRTFIAAALEGSYGDVPEEVHELLTLALAFGDAVQQILEAFNAIYAVVSKDHSWSAPVARVVKDAVPRKSLQTIRRACEGLIDAPRVDEIRRLPLHGRSFLVLADQLRAAAPEEVVTRILDNHRAVQIGRGRSPWLRGDDGRVTLELASYAGHESAARFPSFKIDVVQSLLRDLGRIE